MGTRVAGGGGEGARVMGTGGGTDPGGTPCTWSGCGRPRVFGSDSHCNGCQGG